MRMFLASGNRSTVVTVLDEVLSEEHFRPPRATPRSTWLSLVEMVPTTANVEDYCPDRAGEVLSALV